MRVLLDTCVLSELYKPDPLVTVYEAVNDVPDEHLFICVITIGEIGKGIALLPDCSKATLQSIIRGHVAPDTVIHSDGWRGL